MSHVNLKKSYQALSDRLNLFPQGAPPSELFFRILEVLFTRTKRPWWRCFPSSPST